MNDEFDDDDGVDVAVIWDGGKLLPRPLPPLPFHMDKV